MKGRIFVKNRFLAVLSASALTACVLSSCSSAQPNDTSGAGADEQFFHQTTAAQTYHETVKNEAGENYASIEEMTDETAPSYSPEIDDNSEEYTEITESGYVSVKDEPLSTFSADVDTASYTRLRRMIREYGYVEPSAVRIEEMINYFSYDYPNSDDGTPFSVTTELSDCPWNSETKLLSVGIKANDIEEERPGSNIVFLLDVSGSMYSNDKLPLVQQAFSLLAEGLTENDRVSIVTYAGADEVVLEGVSGNKTRQICEAIFDLEAGGATAGAAGIITAYEIAEKYYIDGGINRVILATDGDLNVGLSSVDELTELIEKERESGVFLSVLGFGTGNYKDNRLEALADNGNGSYSYIDSIDEAEKVLVEELNATLVTVAKDVKFQLEFNPANVRGYRLIGYENRALAPEDFNDDKKDAGEVGAGHTVTALYEIVPADSDFNMGGVPELKYQPAETEAKTSEPVLTDELLTVNIRYKDPDGDTSKLISHPVYNADYTESPSADFNFAAAVAEFGMLLRDSSYSGTSSAKQIYELLDKSNISGDKYKEEFKELVSISEIG